MQKIKLISVQCTIPDEIDKDEMYLKYSGHKIWPEGHLYYRLDEGDLVEIDLTLEVEEGWVVIELWDFDYATRNGLLGEFKFKVDDSPGKYTNSMTLIEKGSSASYFLKWEILEE